MYLHDWKKSGIDGLKEDFEIDGRALADADILLASYQYQNYEGEAFVLFRRDGKLFEVNGSHCSCYGLEGQWTPEETTAEAIKHRIAAGRLGVCQQWNDMGLPVDHNVFADELRAVLYTKGESDV